jgi:hypothetical protein
MPVATTQSRGPTLEQQRAQDAWQCAQRYGKDYVNLA